MTHTAAPATTSVYMIDQTCDEPFRITVQVVEDDSACVACDKNLVGRLAVTLHDSIDLMMFERMCLSCFDASVDSCDTRVVNAPAA